MPQTNRTDLLSFGRLALKYGYITLGQLQECIKIQEQARLVRLEPKRLGEILVEKGYMTNAQVIELFRHQSSAGRRTRLENFEILSKIGKGAMGAVYKARQISLNRLVALKILPPHLAGDKAYISRFLCEARVAAKLNHENTIYIIDVGESKGVYYFAMEYVDGKTAKEILEEQKVFDEKRTVEIALQVARALEHASGYGIVHRDIKPGNIMITKGEGLVKLCDFGLAKELDLSASLTSHSAVAGTPYYISPEQIRNERVDARTDIYSLGATMFHMVTGSVPFTGKSAPIVMAKHLHEMPVPPRQINPRISFRLEALILKCMAKDPAERFQTPSELIGTLQQLLEPVKARPAPKPPKPTRRLIRRRFRRMGR
jgi:serine/threonine-protein kinase